MAEKIVKMTKTEHPNPIPENFIENRIEKFMEEKGMRFSDEQIQAIYGVLKENISVLTGGP